MDIGGGRQSEDRGRIKRAIGTAALLAFGIVTGCGLAEIALRLSGEHMIFPQMFVPDEHTVFRLKPGVREHTVNAGVFDYTYTVNRQGFREVDEYKPSGDPSVQRVLMLGDSFTFGVGVNDDQTYPERVAHRLHAWCPHKRIEVINAGVGGFGTSQEVIMFERYGVPLRPAVVVLGIVGSDPEDNVMRGLHRLDDGRLAELPPELKPGWGRVRAHEHVPGYDILTRKSTLFNWLRLKVAAILSRFDERRYLRAERGRVPTGGSDTAAARALEKGKWDLMERLLDRLRTDVQSSASKLVTALIPHGSTLKAYYTSGRDTAMAPMYELCRKYDLGCIDAAARMVRRYPEGRLDRYREELFIPDGHFSARGYDLVADAVAPSVASALGCVPEQRGRD